MNKRKFGRTNLYVSELCLNTAKMGWANDDAAAFDLLSDGETRVLAKVATVPNFWAELRHV